MFKNCVAKERLKVSVDRVNVVNEERATCAGKSEREVRGDERCRTLEQEKFQQHQPDIALFYVPNDDYKSRTPHPRDRPAADQVL
jgi:hypothetical protein